MTNGSWLAKLVVFQGIPSEENAPYLDSVPSAQAIDYVKCEAIQRAAARLKSSMDAEAQAAQNAIVLPAMEGVQAKCSTKFVNNEFLSCISIRMDTYEAEGDLAREEVIKKYAPRVDRVLADYEAMGCY